MKRKNPSGEYYNLPCSVVTVGCALRDCAEAKRLAKELKLNYHDDGYLSLAEMNKLVRACLPVEKKVVYKRGERPLLRDFDKRSRAVVCALGHYVYWEYGNYYSFFNNDNDEVVCAWFLKTPGESVTTTVSRKKETKETRNNAVASDKTVPTEGSSKLLTNEPVPTKDTGMEPDKQSASIKGKVSNIEFEIVKQIGVISEGTKGWRRELNLVSWNGATPKYDIRDWSSQHDKMGKGITLTAEELRVLLDLLKVAEL